LFWGPGEGGQKKQHKTTRSLTKSKTCSGGGKDPAKGLLKKKFQGMGGKKGCLSEGGKQKAIAPLFGKKKSQEIRPRTLPKAEKKGGGGQPWPQKTPCRKKGARNTKKKLSFCQIQRKSSNKGGNRNMNCVSKDLRPLSLKEEGGTSGGGEESKERVFYFWGKKNGNNAQETLRIEGERKRSGKG